jgi:formylmethanofuran dehydrogenase subunit B
VLQTFEDIACTVCGCVCDDLRVSVDGGRVVRAEGACHLAEPWFLGQDTRRPPVAEVDGRPVPLADAIGQAAEILRRSRSPLILGLSRSSTEGQRAAVSLADRLGATIDTEASRCHAPSIMAFQQAGEPTCSLGEVKGRADLVIYWGSNPAESHPRHFERYAVDPAGEFVPAGRAGRTLVVVDTRRTASAEQADVFLQVAPGRDFEILWTLRGLVRGRAVDVPAGLGVSREQLADLARRLTECRCGVFFFGLGLTRQPLGHLNVGALLRLTAELNDHTHFYARRMRVPGDVTGADTVLCWQTGYPFSVHLGRGYPRYNPGEFSANELLERGEVDASVLVGSAGVAAFTPAAREHLRRIPTIVLDYPTIDPAATLGGEPTIRLTTAVYGVHRQGTAYRMDEVPIPLRSFLESDYPSDGEVLRAIQAAI